MTSPENAGLQHNSASIVLARIIARKRNHGGRDEPFRLSEGWPSRSVAGSGIGEASNGARFVCMSCARRSPGVNSSDRLRSVRTLMDTSAGRSIYQTFPSWGPLALHVSVAEWYSFGVSGESQQMRAMSNGDMLAWHCSALCSL